MCNRQTDRQTMSFLLVDHVAALGVQKLQVVGDHSLLTLVRDFGVRARIEVLAAAHTLVI